MVHIHGIMITIKYESLCKSISNISVFEYNKLLTITAEKEPINKGTGWVLVIDLLGTYILPTQKLK